jgi:formylglycine-generating enzyme required for sulfatase activity
VAIPAGTNWLGSRAGREGEQPRLFRCAGFWLAETEVTVAQFVAYLNDAGVATADFPQVSGLGGKWRARGSGEEPMANLSWPDAEAYVTWLGARLGRVVRVPTEDEWEYAARAGVDGAPFPWGWEPAEGRARFAGSGPAPVKRYAPHRWGVYDLAGNVAEWCAGGTCSRGGSWSDRSSDALRVFHRIPLPAAYRDADTGLRPLLER